MEEELFESRTGEHKVLINHICNWQKLKMGVDYLPSFKKLAMEVMIVEK